MKILVAIFLIISSTSCAWSQSVVTTTPNGCGTGWSLYFVPNSIPLASCTFKQACDSHDMCYDKCSGSFEGKCEYRRCRAGGDLFGKTACQTDSRLLTSQAMAGERRASCDASFYVEMRRLNAGKLVCEAFSIIYRDAVKAWAGPHFSGADQFDGPPQPEETYTKAIAEFLEKGTPTEFRSFVEATDKGERPVNFRRPIRYQSGKGLSN